jgi:malate dehydrogenase (oxaloacetate-decarboxylating)(NADP+)
MVCRPNYLAPMMVEMGDADAAIGGLTTSYADVLRPALQVIGTSEDVNIVSGVYLMIVRDRVYFFTDTTVNVDPTAEELADIAIDAAKVAKIFNIEPRVAMISFSNFGSARHPQSEKVKRAVAIVKERNPELIIDGEMEVDTAIVPEITEENFPFSEVKDANVLVFPNLDAANAAYKLMAHLGGAEAVGPILVGMAKPVHIVPTGAETRDIVNIAALAVVGAQRQ